MAVKKIIINEETIKFYAGLDEACQKQNKGELTKGEKYYWCFRDNRLKELEKYIKEHGTTDKMYKNKEGNKIKRYFALYGEFIEDAIVELGYKQEDIRKETTKGYYKVFNNLARKINLFINEYGRFPSKKDFINILGISQSIINYHGGLYEIKRKMGYFEENDLVDDNMFINRSMGEYIVAKYLIFHSVKYEREKRFCENNQYRCDFYLNDYDVYLEVWGYDDNGKIGKKYTKTKKEKLKIYKVNNLKLVEINGFDLCPYEVDKTISILNNILGKYTHNKNKKITNDIFKSSRTINDEDILNLVLAMSDNKYQLPSITVLENNGYTNILKIIRKRHKSYYNFAKKFNLNTKAKYLDMNELNQDLVYEKIINLMMGNNKDISLSLLKKELKEWNVYNMYIKLHGGWIVFKINFYMWYMNRFKKELPEECYKNIYSLLNNRNTLRVDNNSLMLLNYCVENNDAHNEFYTKMKFNNNLADKKDYFCYFLKTATKPEHLTPLGFNEISSIGYTAFRNHLRKHNMNWIDMLVYLNKFDELNKYIESEYYKFHNEYKTHNIDRFQAIHPYIRSSLMKHKSRHEWLDFLNTVK